MKQLLFLFKKSNFCLCPQCPSTVGHQQYFVHYLLVDFWKLLNDAFFRKYQTFNASFNIFFFPFQKKYLGGFFSLKVNQASQIEKLFCRNLLQKYMETFAKML